MKNTFLIFLFFSASCIIEDTGYTKSIIINETGYTIKIIPYQNGVEQVDMIKILTPNTTTVVFERHDRLKTLKPSFAEILQLYDWIEIVYNDVETIKHQRFSSQDQTGIPYSSNRNITNPENYIKVITKETKHSISGYFSYTFTEQDYLDAKQ